MQIDVPNSWYLFAFKVDIPVKWEGREIDEWSISPDERRQVKELMNRYGKQLKREIYKKGAYNFCRFWCTWVGGQQDKHVTYLQDQAFLLPKSEENLRFLLGKKGEITRLKDVLKSFFPKEFEVVKDAFNLLHPIGYMLIMEASIVYLPGQEEEMMCETAEFFKDIRDDEYLRIIAAKKYGWLKSEADFSVGKSELVYMRVRDELAFKARCAKYEEIFEHIEKGNRSEAIEKLRAMRRGDWYNVEPVIDRSIMESEKDDPDRWYVIAGYLKTKGEEPIRAGTDWENIGEWEDYGLLEKERNRLLKALDLGRPPPLGPLLSSIVPELSIGAWFDTATVAEMKYERDARAGIIGRKIIGPNRLGCHMNWFWCWDTKLEYSQGEASILPLGCPKGPYMIPKRKGVLKTLSERRLSLKEMVRVKGKEFGLDTLSIKPMVLIFEVKSPWLGQPDDKEAAVIRAWFNKTRNEGVRYTAKVVNEVGIKQMPEKDFIRFLGEVVDWVGDVLHWVENKRRMMEESREKKNFVEAESVSFEIKGKVEVMKSILSIVEPHQRAYPYWIDKVDDAFEGKVKEAMDKVRKMITEWETLRIRLKEEKLAELKSLGGIEVKIRIEANSAKDPYERIHGMTIDRSLLTPFWIIQEDVVIDTRSTPLAYEETVVLLPGPHYLIYGNSGCEAGLAWDVKVYINDKLEGQGKVSGTPDIPQFIKLTFTITELQKVQ